MGMPRNVERGFNMNANMSEENGGCCRIGTLSERMFNHGK